MWPFLQQCGTFSAHVSRASPSVRCSTGGRAWWVLSCAPPNHGTTPPPPAASAPPIDRAGDNPRAMTNGGAMKKFTVFAFGLTIGVVGGAFAAQNYDVRWAPRRAAVGLPLGANGQVHRAAALGAPCCTGRCQTSRASSRSSSSSCSASRSASARASDRGRRWGLRCHGLAGGRRNAAGRERELHAVTVTPKPCTNPCEAQ